MNDRCKNGRESWNPWVFRSLPSGWAKRKRPAGTSAGRLKGLLAGKGLLVLFAVLVLVALAGGLGDGGTQDVAQAGAGLGGAVLGDRFLLLGDLALLDGEGDLAGLGVDGGDACIDLLTHRKAARLLLAAVARQLGFADEADRAVADLHLDAVLGHLVHGAGHHVALAEVRRAAGEGILAELLDAEAGTLLVDVEVGHLDLNDVPLVDVERKSVGVVQ